MNDPNLAILWDMDGTLIDTTECHLSTWRQTLKKYGFNLDQEVYQANFGRNNRTIVPLLLGFDPAPDLYEQIVEEKETLFLEIAPKEAKLVAGVESWLASAKNRQISQAVASSGSMENIITMMKSFDLLDYFDFFISGDDLPAKPKPDIFLEAARVIERPSSRCLVIEDSIPGIQAAKTGGMTCIAVATTHDRSELTMADLVVDDFRVDFASTLRDLGLD